MQGLAFIFLLVGGALAAIKRIEKKWHFSIAFFLIALATLMWAISDVIFKKYEMFFSNFFSAFAFYFFGSFIVALLMMFHSRGREKISKYFILNIFHFFALVCVCARVACVIVGVGGCGMEGGNVFWVLNSTPCISCSKELGLYVVLEEKGSCHGGIKVKAD